MTAPLPEIGDEISHGLGSGPTAGVAAALDAQHRARPVVVGHRNGAFLVICAHRAEAGSIASLVRHGSGLVHVAMDMKRLRKLQIPNMPTDYDSLCPDVHVAVDASSGITTGISAADRAHTIRALAAPASAPADFLRPGHVVPIHARRSPRVAATDADIALMLASMVGGAVAAAAFCALTSDARPTEIATPAEAVNIADRLGLVYVDAREVTTSLYRHPSYAAPSLHC